MMRSALLVCLMLFHLVEARGIRVLQQDGHHRFHEEKERSLIKESGGVDAGVVGEAVSVLCRDGQCSSGRSRKIENFSTSSTSTYSKGVKNGGGTKVEPTPKNHLRSSEGFDGNEESFSIESPPVSGHGEVAPGSYPDVVDIVEMDYSPATRKSPIHN